MAHRVNNVCNRDSSHIHLLIAQFIEKEYAGNLRPFYPMYVFSVCVPCMLCVRSCYRRRVLVQCFELFLGYNWYRTYGRSIFVGWGNTT
jgi:hypothetical protein